MLRPHGTAEADDTSPLQEDAGSNPAARLGVA
jgi:hypothetical protein